ncbi:uncharacterized protein Triagg1_4614 [Trichoderma aggressivum f. europaeum]|uniref:Uncharacterized protein n=1 Tax=Trichoderma aggressivum f. europaeum TaxID=173218 RepID=A0AAE1IE08_9HYPO|nr:hypothetical protein Triagg1_4614 [Trichoderma aggressivum f. europaeum]
MAAPSSKTTKNLNGLWTMVRKLQAPSNSPTSPLARLHLSLAFGPPASRGSARQEGDFGFYPSPAMRASLVTWQKKTPAPTALHEDDELLSERGSWLAVDQMASWWANKTLSDSSEPVLSLQGVGYLVRKGIGLATITIEVEQYEGPPKPPNTAADVVTHIDIKQSASGLSSTQENRCLDNFPRDHTDWLFGTVTGRSRWVSLDEVTDEYLKKGWEVEGGGQSFITNIAENKEKGWVAEQVWGFQIVNGERRYCRHVVVTKGEERAQIRLVYDFNDE